MSTAILKTEVQARIDALTYPIDATVLLQNAVDTVGLDLDLTNIISVLDSSTAAIDTNTSNDDVTALNATSIALGVTSKSGGGAGVPIDSLILLNVAKADIHETQDATYLKTGIVETDTSKYPDATKIYTNMGSMTLTGLSAGSPRGVLYDGTHLWVLYASSSGYLIAQFDDSFVYTGLQFPLNTSSNSTRNFCTRGSEIVTAEYGSSVTRLEVYNKTTGYTGETLDLSPAVNITGNIAYIDGEYFVGNSGVDEVYVYDATTGGLTRTITIDGLSSTNMIHTENGTLWVTDAVTDISVNIATDGTELSRMNVGNTIGIYYSFIKDGFTWYGTGNVSNSFGFVVGYAFALSVSGVPYYVRVK